MPRIILEEDFPPAVVEVVRGPRRCSRCGRGSPVGRREFCLACIREEGAAGDD